jgi:hypothetical protein
VRISLTLFSIEGVPQEQLELCIDKMGELAKWYKEQNIDRWAFRSALLKTLYDDADEYFESGEGTFRELAAFDNGVATTLKAISDSRVKD